MYYWILLPWGWAGLGPSQDGRFGVSVNFAGNLTLNSALNNYTSDHPVLPLGQLCGPPASGVSLDFVQLDPNMFNLSHFDVRAFMVVMLCLSTPQGAGLHSLQACTKPPFSYACTSLGSYKE
jgi:hypothetical protein